MPLDSLNLPPIKNTRRDITNTSPTFIDVFAGAGGFSLGLLQSGWKGLFAIEKSPMAFETLKHNLIDSQQEPRFTWPSWLPAEATDIENFLTTYNSQLADLKGLPLLAGAPPCQGFSSAGRRKIGDERNRLFEQYINLVKLLQPKILLVDSPPYTKLKMMSGR
jgi:DNA (cytosine-5)-methyltransferase 1